MPMPKTFKYKKGNFTYENNVDKVNYTLNELTRAALRDVGKYICNKAREKIKKLHGGGLRRSKRPFKSTQFWVRRKETDLQVGFKHDTWYGAAQELGDKGQPKRSILLETVQEEIDKIQEIEGHFLSAIEDEIKAKQLINEDEYTTERDETE